MTTLQAGKVYDVLPEYDAEGYRIRWDIRLPGHMGTDFDSLNLPSQVCYARGYLYPVAQGSFYLINRETGAKRLYQVTKGTVITTGGMEIELGGPVPSGASESYATIYGYQQYVYKKDTKELILIGAEGGTVKTIFTMGDYSMNTDEEYLEVKTASFGGTTIQPIRYYSNKHSETLDTSADLLKNESIIADLVANAVRSKNDANPLIVNVKLTQGAEEQSVRVSGYTGSSSYWHSLGGTPGERYGALGVTAVNENITNGGMGSQHCVAVEAIESYYTSPGHVTNLLSVSHREIGTGIVYNGADDFTITQAYAGEQ